MECTSRTHTYASRRRQCDEVRPDSARPRGKLPRSASAAQASSGLILPSSGLLAAGRLSQTLGVMETQFSINEAVVALVNAEAHTIGESVARFVPAGSVGTVSQAKPPATVSPPRREHHLLYRLCH